MLLREFPRLISGYLIHLQTKTPLSVGESLAGQVDRWPLCLFKVGSKRFCVWHLKAQIIRGLHDTRVIEFHFLLVPCAASR